MDLGDPFRERRVSFPCQRCGHAEELHYPSPVAGELPLNCKCCNCPAFTTMPAEMPRGRDDEDTKRFDLSDEETKP